MRTFSKALAFALLLGMVTAGQTLYKATFEGTPPPNLPGGWNQTTTPAPSDHLRDVCWKVVDKAHLWGEPSTTLAFPSGTRALYFGKIDPNNGRGNYDAGGITVVGTVTTEPIKLDGAQYIRISFYFLRIVEHYSGGHYDNTLVEYRWNEDQKWNSLWWKSSKDPQDTTWKQWKSDPIPVPKNKTSVVIRFTFNSVDGQDNRYLGWLIDDLVVEKVPPPLTVELRRATGGGSYVPTDRVTATVSQPLPTPYPAQTGSYAIVVTGGTPSAGQYKYSLVTGYAFPQRMGFGTPTTTTSEFCIPIVGTPEHPGSTYVEVRIEDYADPPNFKVLGFWIIINPEGQLRVYFEDFNQSVPPSALPPGWIKSPPDALWHVTNEVKGVGTIDEAPPPWVYFGKDDQQTPNYNVMGRRAFGELISPPWDVKPFRGNRMVVEFWHWRHVEFDPGSYDKTYVEVRFDEGPWIRVWEKDSSQTSEKAWTHVVVDKDLRDNDLVVPQGASTVQVKFGFDSVDAANNNFTGWVVDTLRLRFTTNVLSIDVTGLTRVELPQTPSHGFVLPTGESETPYYFRFRARGGTPPYTWEPVTRLPANLILDRNTGELIGVISEKPGQYPFVVRVRDNAGATAQETFVLNVNRKITLFADDFSKALSENWEVENLGLWHITSTVPKVNLTGFGSVAYYGRDETGNYNTGARTVGYLTSKPFDIPAGTSGFRLIFAYWRDVEFYAPGGYDKTYVEVRFLIGTNWSQWYRIWYKDSAHTSEKTWITASVGPYAIPAGATKMQICFVFDSVDRFYNTYVGWLVDNVKVEMSTGGSLLPTTAFDILTRPRGDFAVFNVPNPVRDVHTTTFVVRGVEADLVKVEVYDLTGRLVYVGQALGNELVWHTQDLLGRYLANGVYLYKVYVKVGDTWIVSDVQKIVILR